MFMERREAEAALAHYYPSLLEKIMRDGKRGGTSNRSPGRAGLRRGSQPRRYRPFVEEMETRCLPTAYFVATNGSDTNPGTIDAPFQHIQAAANLAVAGDMVFIRAGTYRETVRPANSGTDAAPIYYAPYNGESVTVSGADLIDPTSWTQTNGSIYQATMPWTLGDGDQIFVDGQMMNEARFPNTSLDVSYPNTLSVTSEMHSGSGANEVATIHNAALNQPANYWVGAILHIRLGLGNWVQITEPVDSSAPGQISFHPHLERVDTPSDYQPYPGNQFWLSGKFTELDTEGEWYRDNPSSTLYLWTPTDDSPANHVVEAKSRDYAFNLINRSHISIIGLNLFASTIETDTRSTFITLDSINANYVSHYTALDDFWSPGIESSGIMLMGDNSIIQNSVVGYSAGNGVLLMGNNDKAINNIIHDVDYEATDTAAICTGDASDDPFQNNEIAYNTIYNCGRSGILFATLQTSHLHHNLVHDVLIQSQDSGAVYTWNRDGLGTEIDHNIVYDVARDWTVTWASAIHLDDNSKHYIVDHNVTFNTWNGLLVVPNNDGIQVYNNTFLGTDNSFVTWPSDQPGVHFYFVNNIFTAHVEWPNLSQISQAANIRDPQEGGADPQFVNPAAYDFELSPTSPAINAGIPVPPYTDGYPGTAPDIGAYWYGVPTWQAGAGTGPMSGLGRREYRVAATVTQADSTLSLGLPPLASALPRSGFFLPNVSPDRTDWIARTIVQESAGGAFVPGTIAPDSVEPLGQSLTRKGALPGPRLTSPEVADRPDLVFNTDMVL
jgi:hypothetical protein